MAKILVTGANGMVGKNLIESLSDYDHELLTPSRKKLNLMNMMEVDKYINKEKPELIIHCAGLVGGINANIELPYDFCNNNLQMGINIIQSANKNNIKKVLNLGSSCMYPRNGKNPLKENLILTGELEPTNEGYAIAKIAIYKLCEYMNKQYGTHYKTIIPCNLYGKWDDFDPIKGHMIPGVIRRMHEGKINSEDNIAIWGDGETRREFMLASDLTDFIAKIIEDFELIPNAINFGLGHDFSINEYYNIIAKVVGYRGGFQHDLTKPQGMKQKLVDSTISRNLWAIKLNTLEEGVKLTYEHFLETL